MGRPNPFLAMTKIELRKALADEANALATEQIRSGRLADECKELQSAVTKAKAEARAARDGTALAEAGKRLNGAAKKLAAAQAEIMRLRRELARDDLFVSDAVVEAAQLFLERLVKTKKRVFRNELCSAIEAVRSSGRSERKKPKKEK